MNLLRILARAIVSLPLIALIWIVWTYDEIHEAWLKHKLGPAYEGRLDNEERP